MRMRQWWSGWQCACLLLGLQWSLGVHLRATESQRDGSVSIWNDMVEERAPPMQHRRLVAGSLVDDSINGRQRYWSTVEQASLFQSAPVWQHESGHATLARLPMLVLPIWFSDELRSTASEIRLKTSFYQWVVGEYQAMSFDACHMEFTFLAQTKIAVSKQAPTLSQVSDAALVHIRDTLGYIEDIDYHAIVIVFNAAFSGDLDGTHAWGNVNGRFIWLPSYADAHVLRHEVGHVLGHSHHGAYQYDWRLARTPTTEDGFDFMSGRLNAPVADLSAASKWWYGWIPDDAVVRLQPEGATDECPQCLAQITDLILYPFDSRSVTPSATRPMAVHMAIASRQDANNRPQSIAYWLSYRSGITASARGVSIHLAWSTYYGPMGASLDSLNLDVGGDTFTLTDSFVLPNTCYVIEPPGFLLDLDPVAAREVRPVVCVGEVAETDHVQLSVRFLDATVPPVPTMELGSSKELGCNSIGNVVNRLALKRRQGQRHLLHYTGCGHRGAIALQLQSPHVTVTAYFYDSYPYAPLVLGAPVGYGAFKRLTHSKGPPASLNYLTEYNEAYVLLVFDETAPAKVKAWVSSTCTVGQCLANEYLDNTGVCVSCPSGRVAPMGSLSIEACLPCGDGFVARGMRTDECVFSPTTAHVEAATEWRIFATASFTVSGSAWDVDNLRVYAEADCSGNPIDASPIMVSSSGFSDKNHISTMVLPGVSGYWGGRPDARGLFYLRIRYDEVKSVGCVRLDQTTGNYAHRVVLQARPGDDWVNVAMVENQGIGRVTLLNEAPAPSSVPSASPSLSQSPSASPSVSLDPSASPSNSPLPTEPLSASDYEQMATHCFKQVRLKCPCPDLILKRDKNCFLSAIRKFCKPTLRSVVDYSRVRRQTIQKLHSRCRARLKKRGILH